MKMPNNPLLSIDTLVLAAVSIWAVFVLIRLIVGSNTTSPSHARARRNDLSMDGQCTVNSPPPPAKTTSTKTLEISVLYPQQRSPKR
ncbi:MAG: hypothetical protein ABW141_03290 [Candidatus Thiodiazotropha endolucinida]